MRILQINKFLSPRRSQTVFQTVNGLRERGHEVSEFSMVHPVIYRRIIPLTLLRSGTLGNKTRPRPGKFLNAYSVLRNRTKLGALVMAVEPEVAHLHNVYHHLSASTFTKLYDLNSHRVNLHDVFPLCPNHSLLKGETLCETVIKQTIQLHPLPLYQQKLLPSIVGTLETYYYQLKKSGST